MNTTHKSPIEAYLNNLNADARAALSTLRKAIRSAAPGATECISYQLPAFRHNGQLLVGFGASAKHCALYLLSDSTVAEHARELATYDTSKGTVRFQPAKPPPASLVRKLVKARLRENNRFAKRVR